jgi:DNA-binding LytR/AlgR family response regulator
VTDGHVLIEKAKNEVMDASVEEIMYIEAAKHQIIYHTEDEAIVSKGSMAKIVKELWEYGFIRVHVAYVVNIRYIKLILRDETVLPISGSYKEETMKNYKMLLERIRYGESR